MMTLLTSMADKELVHMIAWAKKLPGKILLTLFQQYKPSYIDFIIIKNQDLSFTSFYRQYLETVDRVTDVETWLSY